MNPRQRRLIGLLCFIAAVLFVGVFFFLFVRQDKTDAAHATSSASGPRGSSVSGVRTGADPAAAANTDFAGGLDTARRIADPRARAREFGRLLLLWLGSDLEGALAYVRRLPPGPDHTQGLLMALEAVGARDPDRALALASELAVTREQRAFYSALFARLAAQDLPGSLQRLARLPPGEGRANAVRAIVDVWTRVNLPAALAWTEKLSDAADRAVAFESVLAELSASDPLRALALAPKSLTGPALERTLSLALQKLSETDAEGAGAIARLLPAGETRTHATVTAARAWAARSPADALAWVETLPGADLQRLALNNVLDVWSQKDAPTARQYVAGLPPGATQDAAASHLGRTLAGLEPPAAVAWAQALGSASARDAALVSIASAWAQKDPAAASRWASELPASSVQNTALGGALSYWVQQDARASREFVSALNGELQVRAAVVVAPGLAQSDPAGALAWAQSLQQGEARDAAVAAAFARWLDNTPAAARAWLDASALPPATKAMLLRR